PAVASVIASPFSSTAVLTSPRSARVETSMVSGSSSSWVPWLSVQLRCAQFSRSVPGSTAWSTSAVTVSVLVPTGCPSNSHVASPQSQPSPLMDTPDRPVGHTSVTTASATDGPSLVTVKVYATSVPATHGPSSTVLTMVMSAWVRTSVGSSSRLLLGSLSSGPSTIAVLTRPVWAGTSSAMAVVSVMAMVWSVAREKDSSPTVQVSHWPSTSGSTCVAGPSLTETVAVPVW